MQYHELQNLEDEHAQAPANEPQLNGREVWKIRLIQGFHGLNLGLLYVAIFPYFELLGLDRRSIGALMSASLLANAFLCYFIPQWHERTTHKTLILATHTATVLCGTVLSVTQHRWAAVPAIAGCMVSWGHELGFLRTLEGDILSTITSKNKQFEERVFSLIGQTSGMFLGMIATAIILYSISDKLPKNPPPFAFAFRTFTVLELVILLLVCLLDSKTYAERKAFTQEPEDDEEEVSLENGDSRYIICLKWAFFLQAIGEGIVLIPWKVDYIYVITKDSFYSSFLAAWLLLYGQFSPLLSVVVTYLMQGPIKSAIAMEVVTAILHIGVGSSQPDTTKRLILISLLTTSRLYFVPAMVIRLLSSKNCTKELLGKISVHRAFGLCLGPLVAGVLTYHDLYGYCYYTSAALLLLCCALWATCLPLDKKFT